MKIAVLADPHFDPTVEFPNRRCHIADLLLERAVRRLNRFVHPNLVVVPGDLLSDGTSPHSSTYLQRIKTILDNLTCPQIVLLGNHDGSVEAFYDVMERPAELMDIGGVRLLTFLDPEEPGYNAIRSDADIARIAQARVGFDGPIVCIQHVSLLPPGAADCPYNYTNAHEIIEAMREAGNVVSISGHYHPGLEPIHIDGATFINAPALCRPPFAFLEIKINEGPVQVVRHELKMPESLGLIDRHVHTPFAYCSENMDIEKALALGGEFGLAEIFFTEHSSHLYFAQDGGRISDAYWMDGLDRADTRDFRMQSYFSACAKAGCRAEQIGLEVDCDSRGRPVMFNGDRGRTGFINGAIHKVGAITGPDSDVREACEEYLGLLERFLPSGIQALAHPLRVFEVKRLEMPDFLLRRTVELLKRNKVAAEINFHRMPPNREFYELCLREGVRLTFGSDSHNLATIGDFTPHLAFLRECGFDGELKDILI